MKKLISFVIPHKGREAMLLQTLHSIAAQAFDLEKMEVIVVSQNSEISDELAQLKQQLALTVVFNEPDHTISHSRNLGARQAQGEYLAFLDADVALSANWSETMLGVVSRDDDIVLVSAMQVNGPDAPSLERIRTALSNAELDTEVAFLPGRNLFLHRDTFWKVGGFPEHLLTCEDYYFTDRVNQLGNLFYTSKASYVHLGEDKAFIPMFRKEIWRGQSNLKSLSGRRIPLREWPSFVVPIAVLSCWLLAIICLVISEPGFATLAFVGGILPVIVYALRLTRLARGDVGWPQCISFYLLYFPARAIGTVAGIRQNIGTNSHK
ncbi:glycosyltransferase family 2 protein [Alteromonas aestuariivivens]|uniref:Glycosyltransferase family 2 protein n=1 Tax=Alteromonas aestuariivivens TaxID=1938339 RepID=A0A3D8MEM1_9ALTE|nr:glycosyltransferase family A protein [Alteromonas aestuariivivens]RDV29202.1 glycosyltransferase family 2 protein [Alteromonas aestuariivivens]